MELNGAKILYTIHTDIPLLGDLKITQTLVTTWIVMALLSGLAIWLGSNLKLENVSKRQAAAEFIVERLDQFVHDNMGYHFDKYIPLIGSIFALSIALTIVLPPMAENVRTEVCDPFGITEAMQDEVLPELHAIAAETGCTLLDYEWNDSCITDDDTQFFDGFHLDEKYGLPDWTEELFTDIG